MSKLVWVPGILVALVLIVVISQHVFVQRERIFVHELSPTKSDRVFTQGPESGYTIVTYFSFDCKYCRELLEKEFERKGFYEGKITMLYRHYPLASLPLTFTKGVIMECIYNQIGDEGFFDFIENAYAFSSLNQSAQDNDWFLKLAKQNVPSPEQLEKCVVDPAEIDKMQKLKNDAIINSIVFTPTHLIFKNGVLLEKIDRLSASQFLRIIDDLIKN